MATTLHGSVSVRRPKTFNTVVIVWDATLAARSLPVEVALTHYEVSVSEALHHRHMANPVVVLEQRHVANRKD